MEEILASIRRIISEDGAPTQAGAPEQAQPASAPSELRLDREVPAGEDDALLLTEMVNEDGTVVSLAGRGAATAEIEPVAEPPLPEPPVPEPPVPEPPSPAPVPEALASIKPEALAEEPEPELGVSEPEPELGVSEPEAEPEPALAEQPTAEIPVEIDEEPEPAPPPRVQPAAPSPSTAARPRDMADEPSERLVSESAMAASAAALSQLSRTIRRDKELPLGGGRTVDDLVREALEPMLREWLDANLPALVERLVRQEIERMVRRAEEEA